MDEPTQQAGRPPSLRTAARHSCALVLTLCVIGTLVALGMPAPSAARTWQVVPRLELSGTYSDNIALVPADFQDSDFVTEINPGLYAAVEGRRLQGEIDYRMQNLLYVENSDANDTFHQYEADGLAELYREHLFLEASSALFQRIISTAERRFVSNRTILANRTDVLTAAVRPSWQQRLGTLAEGQLSYEFGIVNFDEAQVEDVTANSDVNTLLFSLNSLPRAQRLSWLLDYRHQQIDYDNAEFADLTFDQFGIEGNYRLSSFVDLLALVGYENNDFGPLPPGTTAPEGVVWEVGGRWRPGLRSELEARIGERYFGTTGLARWQQRARRFTTELGFIRDVGTDADVFLGGTSLIETPAAFPTRAFTLTADAFIRTRLEASASFITPKSGLRLTLFAEERDFQTTTGEEQVTAGDVEWEWRFAPRTSAVFGGLYGRQEPRDGQNNDFGAFRVELERRLGARTDASLQYTHTRQTFDDPMLDFEENAVTLTFTWSLEKQLLKREQEQAQEAGRRERLPR